jgi:hypothetical protein
MRALVVVAAAAVASLLVASSAQAKGPESATACGAARCLTIERPPPALLDWGGGTAARPPAPGPYYRLSVRFAESAGESVVWYVPGKGSSAFAGIAGTSELHRLGAPARAAFARLTHGVAPFAAPRIRAVLVDGRRARAPQTYLSLVGRPNALARPPIASDWIAIELRSDSLSPWTDGPALLLSPSTRILQHGFRFARVDGSTVARILARRSLRTK